MENLNFKDLLMNFNLPHDDETLMKFELYMKGILEWNEKINLTAISDKGDFVEKHYVDSLKIAKLGIIKADNRIIDIGTGGGFPGVPLAIAYPQAHFVLIDSLNKRLKVIDELCAEIGIDNVTTVHGRAEDIGQHPEYREGFDCCVSRAVAKLSTLCEYCLPTVKLGGCFVAYKSGSVEDELKLAEAAVRSLGGGEAEIISSEYEDTAHCFVKIKKIKNTPKKYPRKAGKPSKQPL